MSSDKQSDDDFSPKDAFNLFTPIIRPRVKDRPELNVGVPPDIFDQDKPLGYGVTAEAVAGAGIAAFDGGAGAGVGGGPDHGLIGQLGSRNVTEFLLRGGDGGPDDGNWIFGGPLRDSFAVPLILSVIGVVALLGNLLVLFAFVGLRRMRSGQNLMLANIALADIAFILASIPTAMANHIGPDMAFVPTPACRFVHYVIFVSVYVTAYTLVVVCVFGFFGELMRGGSNATGRGGLKPSTGSTSGTVDAAVATHPVPLSMCSAIVSCVVIWAAFVASHLTFVWPSNVNGLTAFEFFCTYEPTASGPDSASSGAGSSDQSRVRTLWVTFLACAFLLPLTIVCGLSAAVLRLQRRGGASGRGTGSGSASTGRHLAVTTGADEATQNVDNDGRGRRRETTIVVMATAVTRAVCWLPLQIFVLVDVFGTGGSRPETELELSTTSYRRWEMLCVCCALFGACVTAPIYRVTSTSCREAFQTVLRRVHCRSRSSLRQKQQDFGGGKAFVGSARRVVDLDPALIHASSAAAVQCRHSPSTSSGISSTAAYYRQHGGVDVDGLMSTSMTQHQYQQQQQPQPQQHFQRPQHLSLPPCRLSASDMSETILSIISDSSNHINYA